MTDLVSIVERFPNVRAFVVGDAMTDLYCFGRVERLSPEAPVPIFVTETTEHRPGGAANVSANLTALGLTTWSSFAAKCSTKIRYLVGHHMVFRIDDDVVISQRVIF